MRDRIATELKAAEQSGDEIRLTTLRLISAAIRDRDLAARSDEGVQGASDIEILSLLRTMVGQRNDSAQAYEEDGRLELAEREREEASVIREFLPRPLTEAEIEAAIAAAVEESGANGLKDLGRVMTLLKARHVGQIDYGAIGARVLAALS